MADNVQTASPPLCRCAHCGGKARLVKERVEPRSDFIDPYTEYSVECTVCKMRTGSYSAGEHIPINIWNKRI